LKFLAFRKAKVRHPALSVTQDNSSSARATERFVMPLVNGIQIEAAGMDPGFYRVKTMAEMTDWGESRLQLQRLPMARLIEGYSIIHSQFLHSKWRRRNEKRKLAG
jgi:hypothetical protein